MRWRGLLIRPYTEASAVLGEARGLAQQAEASFREREEERERRHSPATTPANSSPALAGGAAAAAAADEPPLDLRGPLPAGFLQTQSSAAAAASHEVKPTGA